MQWSDLFTALALVLILEGLLPFANPPGMRRAAEAMHRLSDPQLRKAGFVAMLVGVTLLYVAR